MDLNLFYSIANLAYFQVNTNNIKIGTVFHCVPENILNTLPPINKTHFDLHDCHTVIHNDYTILSIFIYISLDIYVYNFGA